MPMAEHEKTGSYSKSLLKTLLILEGYADQKEYGIKELSDKTNIPPSTVWRIVNTLVMKNFLEQNSQNLKYRLSTGFFNIASHYNTGNSWVDAAKEHMESLVTQYNETVNLAVLSGIMIKYLTKVDSTYIVRPNFNVGRDYPAINTALGKCMIAFLSEKEIGNVIIRSKEEGYLFPETDEDELICDLLKIKERGYAVEDEEFQKGLFCISAPICDESGKCVAAISTSIPKQRLDFGDLPELITSVKQTASLISSELIHA